MRALDLFAGPGGFDLGAAALVLRPLGIEWDDAACATRAAAGLDTLQGDVSLLDPVQFAPRALLIGSPPCPTFSTAGDQGGNLATDLILACATALTRGEDTRAAARDEVYARLLPTAKSPERAARDAVMTMLVVEPLRYALALLPERIALEQVPAVLPIWREFGRLLEPLGYRFWAGILNAADHGVPQTRRRAFLLASRSGPVSPPRPTHCRGGALTLDGELLPWVSMAAAPGLDEPLTLFTNRGQDDHGNRQTRDGGSPAPTVSGKSGGQWYFSSPATTVQGDPRVGRPGHKERENGEGQFEKGAVRITLQEAAILQGFPPDYPWQGSRTKQFECVGNAVPPPLAEAVLRALLA